MIGPDSSSPEALLSGPIGRARRGTGPPARRPCPSVRATAWARLPRFLPRTAVGRTGPPVRTTVWARALFALVIGLVGAAPAAAEGGVEDLVTGLQPPTRLGIRVQPMTPELRRYFEAPRDRGVLVSRVEPGSPADRAGVRVGDVIVRLGDVVARHPRDVVREALRAPSGEPLEIEVVRKGRRRTLSVTPEGPPRPYINPMDPESWREWQRRMEEALGRGSEELRRQMEELDRRLRELERRLREDEEDLGQAT